jgi:hypothetical protein
MILSTLSFRARIEHVSRGHMFVHMKSCWCMKTDTYVPRNMLRGSNTLFFLTDDLDVPEKNVPCTIRGARGSIALLRHGRWCAVLISSASKHSNILRAVVALCIVFCRHTRHSYQLKGSRIYPVSRGHMFVHMQSR